MTTDHMIGTHRLGDMLGEGGAKGRVKDVKQYTADDDVAIRKDSCTDVHIVYCIITTYIESLSSHSPALELHTCYQNENS